MTDTAHPAATVHAAFARHIAAALDALEAAGTLPAGLPRAAVTVEPPRDVTHGDLSTNAAMVLAKPAGTNPRALAEALVAELAKIPQVASATIAGPGFLNFHITKNTLGNLLHELLNDEPLLIFFQSYQPLLKPVRLNHLVLLQQHE